MTHDDPDAHLPAKRWSASLTANDLIKAAYRNADMALGSVAGRPANWVVIGKPDDIALPWPRPLAPERLDAVRLGAMPLTGFEAVRRAGSRPAGDHGVPLPSDSD